MGINVRIRDGMCPDPTTGDGGATEGDIRGSYSDMIDTIGVVDLANGHCLVTENTPAALSVLIAPGIVYIPNADYDELDSDEPKFYEAIIDAEAELEIAENTSGSTRVDLVCVKIDKTITPDEHASNIATLIIVQGTPGAGAPTLPDNHAKLAEVEVANGASTIVTADITDSRVQAKINSDYESVTPTSVTVLTGKTFDDELRLKQIATPADPATGYNKLYFKSDGKLYYLDENSVETEVGAGGGGSADGWTAAETWTRESDNTFSEPIDATLKYQKGDKIRYKQGAGYKYQYIISVGAYSGGKTIMTTTGGSDYVFTNGTTITDNYYSHQENPIGFPDFFNTTASFTVATFDNGSGGQPTTNVFRFKIFGNCLTGFCSFTGTKAGTDMFIKMASSGLPAPVVIGNANVGSGNFDNGSFYVPVVFLFRSSGEFWFTNGVNINDNSTVANLSSVFSYQI